MKIIFKLVKQQDLLNDESESYLSIFFFFYFDFCNIKSNLCQNEGEDILLLLLLKKIPTQKIKSFKRASEVMRVFGDAIVL